MTAMLTAILYGLAFLLYVAIFAKLCSRNARQAVLLIASYVFYLAWGAWFLSVQINNTSLLRHRDGICRNWGRR